jgi:hypothetical protein
MHSLLILRDRVKMRSEGRRGEINIITKLQEDILVRFVDGRKP